MYVVKGENAGITDAIMLENKKDFVAAAALYEKLLKKSPDNIFLAQRLMVLYRRTGNSKKEIITINAAIKIHERKYKLSNKLSIKATAISKQLNKLLGHSDKKGKPVLVSDDILKLQLRKERLLKKINKS